MDTVFELCSLVFISVAPDELSIKFAYIPQTCFIELEVVIEDIFYKLYLFYQCNI